MKWPFSGRDAQSQTGGQGNTQNIGIPFDAYIQEMQRKDADIKTLITEKEALQSQLHTDALERQTLTRDLADLRTQHAGLQARLANPTVAFAEHQQRGSQIEQLLQDAATGQSLGENRILSALNGFAALEYADIDALLAETEQRSLLIAASAAFGRGLIAEDAVKWHDAYDHYKRAAALSDDLDQIAALARMAWRLGKSAEAITLHERLCDAAKAEHGDDHPKYAAQLNNLATVVEAQGRYDEAETLYRQALAIDLATMGDKYPSYATRLINLAGVVRAQGRYSEAETLYRQALMIDLSTIGDSHPDYAAHLNTLAGIVQAQGRFADAEPLYRQALEIGLAAFGNKHPRYATGLNNLAGVVHVQGRVADAAPLYAEALTICRDTLTDAHPTTQLIAQNYLDTLKPLNAPADQIAAVQALLIP